MLTAVVVQRQAWFVLLGDHMRSLLRGTPGIRQYCCTTIIDLPFSTPAAVRQRRFWHPGRAGPVIVRRPAVMEDSAVVAQ